MGFEEERDAVRQALGHVEDNIHQLGAQYKLVASQVKLGNSRRNTCVTSKRELEIKYKEAAAAAEVAERQLEVLRTEVNRLPLLLNEVQQEQVEHETQLALQKDLLTQFNEITSKQQAEQRNWRSQSATLQKRFQVEESRMDEARASLQRCEQEHEERISRTRSEEEVEARRLHHLGEEVAAFEAQLADKKASFERDGKRRRSGQQQQQHSRNFDTCDVGDQLADSSGDLAASIDSAAQLLQVSDLATQKSVQNGSEKDWPALPMQVANVGADETASGDLQGMCSRVVDEGPDEAPHSRADGTVFGVQPVGSKRPAVAAADEPQAKMGRTAEMFSEEGHSETTAGANFVDGGEAGGTGTSRTATHEERLNGDAQAEVLSVEATATGGAGVCVDGEPVHLETSDANEEHVTCAEGVDGENMAETCVGVVGEEADEECLVPEGAGMIEDLPSRCEG